MNQSQLLEFIQERRDLFDAQPNPFVRTAWLTHFIEQVARPDWTFHVPECYVAGESLALLYSEDAAPEKRMALTNYYSSLYSPMISAADDRRSAMAGIVQDMVSRPTCSTITLAPISTEAADELTVGFAEQSWYLKRYFCFGNWYLPCDGLSFEDYMAARPSQTRNTWSRKAKKFAGSQLLITTDAKAMADYNAVYQKSWKVPEPYPDFVPGWANICAKNGWLRLGIAYVDDKPIAAQFWFVIDRKAYIFKLAYDEEFAKLSAGTVLSAKMFEHVLDVDKVTEIDYLTGDDPYKQAWMSHRRERVGVLACNLFSARGAMVAAKERVASMIKERTVSVG